MKKILWMMICILLLTGCGEKGNDEEEIIESTKQEETEVISKIKVEIKGKVNVPGVYELEENNRVINLIEAAGGLTKDANTDTINLSKKLTDEMVVIIYSNQEIEAAKKEKIRYEVIEIPCNCPDTMNEACIEEKKEETEKKVNLNTATLEELTNLPGIGEAKAKKIIEYREKTPFVAIEDITNITGIGEANFEKIKDFIMV